MIKSYCRLSGITTGMPSPIGIRQSCQHLGESKQSSSEVEPVVIQLFFTASRKAIWLGSRGRPLRHLAAAKPFQLSKLQLALAR